MLMARASMGSDTVDSQAPRKPPVRQVVDHPHPPVSLLGLGQSATPLWESCGHLRDFSSRGKDAVHEASNRAGIGRRLDPLELPLLLCGNPYGLRFSLGDAFKV